MFYQKSIKEIRKLKNIKISSMSIRGSRLAYSRIENNKSKLKLEDLEEVIDTFNLTPEEFIEFSENDNEYNVFKSSFTACVEDCNNEKAKSILLKNYYIKSDLSKKTKKELCYFASISGTFHNVYAEVKSLSDNDIHLVFDRLINQSFYSEYDYFTALNIVTILDEQMQDKLISKLHPIKLRQKRNHNIVKYDSSLILNVVSLNIYNLNYKKALYYIELLKKELDIRENYYLRISLLYHENLALRFLKQDTLYIEKARDVIKIVKDLGDHSLFNAFENELNNLTNNPKYYLKNYKFPVVTNRS